MMEVTVFRGFASRGSQSQVLSYNHKMYHPDFIKRMVKSCIKKTNRNVRLVES